MNSFPFPDKFMENQGKILVSACLLGVKCRYDGTDKKHTALNKLLEDYELIPVCPEQLGGLPTPRPRAEIRGGDGNDVLKSQASVVQIETGKDITNAFINGAEETFKIAEITGIQRAILKSRSPSCGNGTISLGGKQVPGDGVTAALLKANGIKVESL